MTQQGIDLTSTKSEANAVSTTPHRLSVSMQIVELKRNNLRPALIYPVP